MAAGAICTCLLVSLSGCGAGPTATRSASSPSSDVGAWSAKTQALCREKRTAIAGLGYVHITYGGIARAGLPAVKRSLVSYLDRLLAVLREFARRQHQLVTPPALVSTMSAATQISNQSQAATLRLRGELAKVASTSQLSAAFRTWLAALQRLSARGNAVAERLHLPDCRSASR